MKLNLVSTIESPEYPRNIQFFDEGRQLLFSTRNEIKILDLQCQSIVRTRRFDFEHVMDFAKNPSANQIAVVDKYEYGKNSPVVFWDLETDTITESNVFLGNTGHQLKFSPYKNWMVSAGSHEKYHVTNTTTWQDVFVFPGGEWNPVIDFHPDGITIMAGDWSQANINLNFCEQGRNSLEKIPSYQEETRPEWKWFEDWMEKWMDESLGIPAEFISGAIFNPRGDRVIVSHHYLWVYRYPELTDGERLALPKFYFEQAVIYSKQGHLPKEQQLVEEYWSNPLFITDNLLICGSPKGEFYVWDADSGVLLHKFITRYEQIRRIAFCPEKQLLASAGNDNKIKIWQISL